VRFIESGSRVRGSSQSWREFAELWRSPSGRGFRKLVRFIVSGSRVRGSSQSSREFAEFAGVRRVGGSLQSCGGRRAREEVVEVAERRGRGRAEFATRGGSQVSSKSLF
jgi:hypothetical protein